MFQRRPLNSIDSHNSIRLLQNLEDAGQNVLEETGSRIAEDDVRLAELRQLDGKLQRLFSEIYAQIRVEIAECLGRQMIAVELRQDLRNVNK